MAKKRVASHFHPGDVVYLKTGGPPMTVNGVSRDKGRAVNCYWFQGDELKEHWFDSQAVTTTKPIAITPKTIELASVDQ